jgi:hypothetical protein
MEQLVDALMNAEEGEDDGGDGYYTFSNTSITVAMEQNEATKKESYETKTEVSISNEDVNR